MSHSEHIDAMALEHLGEAYTISAGLQKYLDIPRWNKEIIEDVRSKIARLAGLLHVVESYTQYTGDEAIVPNMEDMMHESYVRVAAHADDAAFTEAQFGIAA